VNDVWSVTLTITSVWSLRSIEFISSTDETIAIDEKDKTDARTG